MMASVMESISFVTLTILAVLIACIFFYVRSMLNFWKDRGIPHSGPSIFFKNVTGFFLGKTSFYEMQIAVYNSLNGHKYGRYCDFKPSLMIRDPEMIERVLIKDFNHFMDRGTPSSNNDDIVSMNLANAEGDRWRALRYKLTPTFSSGKLKGMFGQMNRACEDLIRYIDEGSENGDGQLETKPLMNRYLMNVIASCAFGIEFSYNDKERDKFLEMVKKLTTPSLSQILRNFAVIYFPAIFKLLRISIFDPEVGDYFVGLVEEAFRYRKENNIRRNDFLQLLLDLKRNEDNGISGRKEEPTEYDPEDAIVNQMNHVSGMENKYAAKKKLFSIKSITAQAVVFLTAGAEGASGLMQYFLFSMATHPDIQRRVQEEVDQNLQKQSQWNYEMLKEMTYLDQVLQETMRMYPTSVLLIRKCTKPYHLPDSDTVIEVGTSVVIPVMSLHYDPQYYPDPEKFDPDRWSENNYKPNGQFLPFGDGPRICIAMRFAVLQMKVCLAHLISEYNITLGSKTHVPLHFEPKSFNLLPIGGIWLKFEKRKTHIK